MLPNSHVYLVSKEQIHPYFPPIPISFKVPMALVDKKILFVPRGWLEVLELPWG